MTTTGRPDAAAGLDSTARCPCTRPPEPARGTTDSATELIQAAPIETPLTVAAPLRPRRRLPSRRECGGGAGAGGAGNASKPHTRAPYVSADHRTGNRERDSGSNPGLPGDLPFRSSRTSGHWDVSNLLDALERMRPDVVLIDITAARALEVWSIRFAAPSATHGHRLNNSATRTRFWLHARRYHEYLYPPYRIVAARARKALRGTQPAARCRRKAGGKSFAFLSAKADAAPLRW